MNKIKICFVETNCKKNGPIKQTLNIIQYMDRNVFEPILLTLWPEEIDNSMLDEYRALNISTYCANLGKWGLLLYGKQKVKQMLKKIKPDIVHGVGMPLYRVTLGYKGAIHFLTLRNYCYEDYPGYYGKIKGGIMAMLDMRLIRKRIAYEPFVTCSHSLATLYKERNKMNLPFIRNGVNIEQYKERDLGQVVQLRQRLGLPIDKVIFVYGGFFIERKNQQECIEGFLKSDAASYSVLLLLGNGKEYERLGFKYNNYSQIIFAGQVDNIQDYLHASDVYISTSKSEGMPNGVLEAMASGLPLLLSNIPQHLEVLNVNDVYGESYILGNIEDLRNKIDWILEQDLIDMGKKSHNIVVQEFSANIMSKRYQSLYLKVFNESNTRKSSNIV